MLVTGMFVHSEFLKAIREEAVRGHDPSSL
jgi:hypothetical protein